jgi:hypothetical protein
MDKGTAVGDSYVWVAHKRFIIKMPLKIQTLHLLLTNTKETGSWTCVRDKVVASMATGVSISGNGKKTSGTGPVSTSTNQARDTKDPGSTTKWKVRVSWSAWTKLSSEGPSPKIRNTAGERLPQLRGLDT